MFLTLINIILSCLTASRQYSRYNNVPANSQIDVFLDTHYPDDYLDKIYNNKKWIQKD